MTTRVRRAVGSALGTLFLLLLLAGSPALAQERAAPTVHCQRTGDDVATLTTELPPGLREADVERTHWASKTTGAWSNEYATGPATTYHASVRPGLEAEGRVRFQTHDGWTGWSGVAGCAAAPPFILEYGDRSIPLANAAPGPFDSDLESATWAELSSEPSADFPTACPDFSTWRVERYYEDGNLHLKELFERFAAGAEQMDPSDTGSLMYLDRDDQEARRINFFGFVPLHYESISLDSRNPGQAAVEVMEFEVERCEYA